MINKIIVKAQQYQTELQDIAGGHSSASCELAFYENAKIESFFDKSNNEELVITIESKFWRLDIWKSYKDYKGSINNIDKGELASFLVKTMQDSWNFSKLFSKYNAQQLSFPEGEVQLIINDIEHLLLELNNEITGCLNIFIDDGGNDYSMILVECVYGVLAFEFLNFID